ncbi:MAG: polyketide cyclase [Herminiimonas sp.]|nr:polyketide cyclase [Herminiimonas sp.]
MFKIIAVAIVCVVAAVLSFAATRPDIFRVQRMASIKAAPDKIFAHINDFRSFGAWSPYEKKDPGMKRTYGGAANGKGAIYEWEGNGEVGKGRMEITEASAPGKIAMKLDFEKPFEAHNIVEFTMVPKGDSTEVTWAMHGPTPYLGKIMHLFINMDNMVGKDFEKGLANLKAIAET